MGRALIAFTVDAERVSIIGLFYGGRDYEALLQSDADE
jgi:toxin ParE1/3/4